MTTPTDAEAHLLHHELTHTIIGGFFATHTELGAGFLEPVYSKVRNYLRASKLRVGLLLNFGRVAEFRRVVV